MPFDLKLLALSAAALAVTQGLAWLLARGLGARLERSAVALGLLLPLLFLAPWLGGTRLLVPCDFLQPMIPDAPPVRAVDRHELLNDSVFQFLPWEIEVRHALRAGRLPLWSDLLEGGSSPWVNPQAGVLSPLALLARPFPIQYFLLAMLALKLLLAAEGTWLLARAVGVSRAGAALAAAGFALSGGMLAWALFPHTAALAWVPWLTLGVIRLFRVARPRRLGKTVATTALLTAALLLSGHPETAAVGGLFAAACGLSLRARRRGLLRGLGAAAVAACLGFALAAPLIVPFALRLPLSQRAQETLAQSLPVAFVSATQPLTWFVPGFGRFILAPTNPRAFGLPYRERFRGPANWVDAESGYAGLLAFAGSLIALVAARRRAWPFLGFALACLLLAAQLLPVAHLLFAVPALRAPAYTRFLLVGCLALSIAGAMGFDHLFSRRLPGGPRRWLPALALGAAAWISLAQDREAPVILLWVLLLAAALLGVFRPRLGRLALGLVLLLDLVPWGQGMLPAGQPALFYPPSRLLDAARRETAGGTWRAVGEDFALFPSLLPVYGVAEVRPHNPLAPVPYLRTLKAAFGFAPSMGNYVPFFHNAGHPLLDFLGVRAVVWSSPHPVPPWFQRIDDGITPSFRLYRNPRALPRWFVPARIDVIRPDDLERWIAALDDGRRVAVYAPDLAGQPTPASVTALAARPGRITLEVSAPRPTLVATSLGWPEGWKVWNGKTGTPLPVTVVDGAFLGFRVPAGTTRVELRFVPPGLAAGSILAGIALAVCALLLAYGLLFRATR
ncbi:MAG TPA: hypothetical protein VIA62_08645 [Thermoanaerobaculia bacterium]|nr:hypothetical protein [Thermoanaerobaculia bacterium]